MLSFGNKISQHQIMHLYDVMTSECPSVAQMATRRDIKHQESMSILFIQNKIEKSKSRENTTIKHVRLVREL